MTEQSSQFRARIPPVDDGLPRPLWSVMIPTFNCAAYLEQALTSVLSQDPGEASMQIDVIDDCSSDNPELVVSRIGKRRAGFHRNEGNLGHIRNFEQCLKRARGHLVHLLHGDDYVQLGFYSAMEHAFSASQAGAAFCRQIFVDEAGVELSHSTVEQTASGILPDALALLATEQRIMTPSIVVRREVYERLGAFDERLRCSEDWEMWVRIAAHYPIWYHPEPLAAYRMHGNSNTGRHLRSGEDMRYTALAIQLFRSELSEDVADDLTRRAKETYAHSALDSAGAMLKNADVSAALALAREAFRLSRSRGVWLHAAKVAAKALTS